MAEAVAGAHWFGEQLKQEQPPKPVTAEEAVVDGGPTRNGTWNLRIKSSERDSPDTTVF